MSLFCGQKIELKEISNLSKFLVAQWRLNQDLKAVSNCKQIIDLQPILSLFT